MLTSTRLRVLLGLILIGIVLALPTATVVAQPADGAVAELTADQPDATSHAADDASIPLLWYLAPICGFVALFMARKYYQEVLDSDEGDEDMIRVAGYVRDGAMAYLYRQYKVVGVVFAGLVAILAWMAYGLKVQHGLVPFAFLTGGFFSGLCG